MSADRPSPPVLTDVIEQSLAEVEKSVQATGTDVRYEALRAQLPDLLEQALNRVKPQLVAEFEALLKKALQH